MLLHLVMGSTIVVALVTFLLRLRKFVVSCCLLLCPNLLPPGLTNTSILCLFAEQMQRGREEKPFSVFSCTKQKKKMDASCHGAANTGQSKLHLPSDGLRHRRLLFSPPGLPEQGGEPQGCRGRTQLGIRKYNNSSCNTIQQVYLIHGCCCHPGCVVGSC